MLKTASSFLILRIQQIHTHHFLHGAFHAVGGTIQKDHVAFGVFGEIQPLEERWLRCPVQYEKG